MKGTPKANASVKTSLTSPKTSAQYQAERLERIRSGLPGRIVPFRRPPAVRKFWREYMRDYRARKANESEA